MTSEVTQAVTDERSPAQFFFEMGFGACYAEAIVRNGNQVPFPLSDEDMERQWAISREAYDDPAELDAMLARIESTRLTAQSGEGRAAIIEECAAVADGWNPGRKDRVTETSIATAIRELSGDTREGISPPTQRMAETLGARFVMSGEGRSGAGEDVEAVLRDPNAVHVNMLRGGIARPSVAQIIHIYGEEALLAALNARQSGEGERGQ